MDHGQARLPSRQVKTGEMTAGRQKIICSPVFQTVDQHHI